MALDAPTSLGKRWVPPPSGNSPILISHLFDGLRAIHLINDKKETITIEDIEQLKKLFNDFVYDVLGLKEEKSGGKNELIGKLMDTILSIREYARREKNYAVSDMIRTELSNKNITVKDTKDGPVWEIND